MDVGTERAWVWVDGWQMACCGTPFSIGDSVSWSIQRDVDRPFLSRATSQAVADRIDYREEHHEGPVDQPLGGSGLVQKIWAVSCRYELDEDGGAFSPAVGSGRLDPVENTFDRPPRRDEARHLGWIVELDQFRLS